MKKTVALFAIIFLLFSCSKDDEATKVTYQEENFLSSLLVQSKYNENTTEFTGADRESGIEFTPLVSGNMKAIKIRMPQVLSNIPTRVTLWDAITQVPIKTFYIQAQTAGVETVLDINPTVQLEKNKKYCFSIQHRSVYSRTANNNVQAVFPMNCNNIKIDRLTFKLTADQAYPNSAVLDRYWGDFSFVFQQTE
jgi:hypothetical protein